MKPAHKKIINVKNLILPPSNTVRKEARAKWLVAWDDINPKLPPHFSLTICTKPSSAGSWHGLNRINTFLKA